MNKRNHKKRFNIYCAHDGIIIVYAFMHCATLLDGTKYSSKHKLRQKIKSARKKFVKSKECKHVYKMIMSTPH
jgi:hypothetical protein